MPGEIVFMTVERDGVRYELLAGEVQLEPQVTAHTVPAKVRITRVEESQLDPAPSEPEASAS